MHLIRFNKNKIFISALAVISFCTLSLSIIRIFGGYSVTVASLFLLCYIYFALQRFSLINIIVILFFSCYFWIIALINSTKIDEAEFIKSFLLTFVFIFIYVTSFSCEFKYLSKIDLKLILKISGYSIFAFEIIQISEQLVLGTTSSWFLLDGISISTADDIGRFEAVNFLGFFRPTSFFHEPSYMAAVCFIIYLVILKKFPNEIVFKTVLILSILLSMSALVIALLLLNLLLDYIIKQRRNILLNLTVLIVALMCVGGYLSEFFRIGEIAQEGTSGYVRFVEPFISVKNSTIQNPFGIPLGQSDVVFNNSLFLFPLYFGVITPFLFLLWLYLVFKNIYGVRYLSQYIFGSLCLVLVNGAIFTIETAFLFLFLNQIFVKSK